MMKNYLRWLVGFLAVVAFCWGLLVGLFTWDSSRIFPAYEKAAKVLFKPITYPIERAFEGVIERANR